MICFMAEGVVRRNVDARIISYALSVAESDSDASKELQITFQGCAAAALQAASGMVGLSIACRTASNSPAVLDRFESERDKKHFQTLMASLGASVDEAWVGELKELFEVIVVLAAQTSDPGDEERFRQWAQGLFLDTREMCIGDAHDVKANVEIGDEPEHKRRRVRKPRSSKEVYEQDRYENLVTKAIAMGVQTTRAVLAGGQVMIVGATPKGDSKLIKLRGSITDAQDMCERANEEIRLFRVGEQFP